MVKVKIGNKELYLDGYLKSNLDISKKHIKKDWDMVFIIDGIEGGGKSVLAQHMAYYCDPTLTIKRVTFTSNEFKDQIKKAKPYEAVIFDEAYGSLSSRGAMSFINKMLVSMLAQIRQKNLFVFIVLPCFFELDKYPALWRSRALIHVYSGDQFQRGFFSFYNQERKKDLYMHGKKFYEYKVPPNFRGRFTKGYMVDEKEYRKRKLKALDNTETVEDKRFKEQRNGLLLAMNKLGLGEDKIAKALRENCNSSLDHSSIGRILKQRREVRGE